MDPDATWHRLLGYAAAYADGCTNCPGEHCPHDADLIEISDLMVALGSWSARGGYDPRR